MGSDPSLGDPTFQKLVGVLGRDRAAEVVAETLKQIGVRELVTPEDRYRFGSALILRGGVLEAIGRSIKIQAILHGAKEQ